MLFPFFYTLIRTDRKTIGICILKDGQVQVRAPRYVSVSEIEKVLYNKTSWILSHRNKIMSMEHIRWKYGAKIPYLGELRTIVPGVGNVFCLTDDGIQIPDGLTEENIPAAVIQWYVTHGKPYLTSETKRLAEKYGLTVHSVTVNRANKRWGSCTVQTRRIHYSWRLMFLPPKAVEYVITHELAHILHTNHSTSFWTQVKNWMDDYEEGISILREYEKYFMMVEGI